MTSYVRKTDKAQKVAVTVRPMQRYSANIKRDILDAIEDGRISETDAMTLHNLSREELTRWRVYGAQGLKHLKALMCRKALNEALDAVANMTWADEPHEGTA